MVDLKKWIDKSDVGLFTTSLRDVDFSGFDLRGRNFNLVNLTDCNFEGLKLAGASFKYAYLTRCNFIGADLRGADFTYAALDGSKFRNSNVSGARFCGANLEKIKSFPLNLLSAIINLQITKLPRRACSKLILASTEIQPREGEIIGWKKCYDNILVKLKIPAKAKRSNAPGSRKCRADCAIVLKILGGVTEAQSQHDPNFLYRVGSIVRPDSWTKDRLVECGHGIHYFLTKEEARAY